MQMASTFSTWLFFVVNFGLPFHLIQNLSGLVEPNLFYHLYCDQELQYLDFLNLFGMSKNQMLL